MADSTTDASFLGAIAADDPGVPSMARQRVRRSLFHYGPPPAAGRFVITGPLGAGSMGEVFSAHDPALDRTVAVKLLPRGASAKGRRRMVAEARTLARVAHPNVVDVFDVGTTNTDQVFIAMELIDGVSLKRWIRSRTRTPAEIRACFAAAGDGLHAAHVAGIVHRDFKPDNVMVSSTGRVLVIDFGLAHDDLTAVTPWIPRGGNPSAAESVPGGGTPAYASPEQLRGLTIGPKSDQFSFCVSLYEALAGSRPFSGTTPVAMIASMERGQFAPNADGVPPSLRSMLARGLRANPADRFPDMAAVCAALRRPARARWPVCIGGFAILVAGLVAGTEAFVPSAEQRCTQRAGPDGGLWQPGDRAILGRRGGPVAAALQALDAYADTWFRDREAVCAAASPSDTAAACLAARRREFSAAIHVAGVGGDTLNATALPLIAELDYGTDCALDSSIANHGGATFGGPGATRALDALAHAEATRRFGKLDAARTAAKTALALANETASPLLQARGQVLLGEALLLVDEFKAATASFERAYAIALQAEAHRVALQAATGLSVAARHDASIGARTPEDWLRAAEAELARGRLENTGGHARLVTERAHLLTDRRDSAAAEVEYAHAYAIWQTVEGEAGLRQASSLIGLGGAQHRNGKNAASRTSYESALAYLRPRLGEHHNVANLLANLADLESDEGRYTEAIALLEESRAIHLTLSTQQRGALAVAAHELSRTYFAMGEFDKAREEGESALAIWRETAGENSREVGAALVLVANVALATDDRAEAETRYAQARSVFEAATGADSSYVGVVSVNLGLLATEQGKHEAAMEHLLRALRIYGDRFGADAIQTTPARVNLAELHLAMGHNDAALQEIDRVVATLEDVRGDDSASLVGPLQARGRARSRASAGESGESTLLRARTLSTQHAGATAPSTLEIELDLGDAALLRGDHANAKRWFDAVRDASPEDVPHDIRGWTMFGHAQIAWKRDHAGARARAKRARSVYCDPECGPAYGVDAIDAWLAAH